MTRAIILTLALAGCASAPVQTAPEPPRLRCVNMGQVPASDFFVYLCTFTGQPEPEAPPVEIPVSLGES